MFVMFPNASYTFIANINTSPVYSFSSCPIETLITFDACSSKQTVSLEIFQDDLILSLSRFDFFMDG